MPPVVRANPASSTPVAGGLSLGPQHYLLAESLSLDKARQMLLHYLGDGSLDVGFDSVETTDIVSVLRGQACQLCNTPHALLSLIAGSLAQRQAISLRLLQLLPEELRWRILAHAPHYATAVLLDTLPAKAEAHTIPASYWPTLLPTLLRQLAVSGRLGGYLQLRAQSLLLALRDEEIGHPLPPSIQTLLHECLARLNASEQCDKGAIGLKYALTAMTHASPE